MTANLEVSVLKGRAINCPPQANGISVTRMNEVRPHLTLQIPLSNVPAPQQVIGTVASSSKFAKS